MAIRFQQEDELGSLSEINVTPLVDVMLVLLIIFMITVPMMTQGLEVELPRAEGESFESAEEETATISIGRDGTVWFNETRVGRVDIGIPLETMLRGEEVESALVRADQGVPYGRVVEVLDVMSRAGVRDVGMLTETWTLDTDQP
ncbi:MAG: ExbD/TolR family protein [Acidobacteria bacterium]|nr:ExbD/TolR family protein [Acidobacteriota bacterium]